MSSELGLHGHFPDHLLASNQTDTEENVGLFHAAESGSTADVLKYLKRGAKPNYFYRPEDQMNSLHVAAHKGYEDVVNVLLENGAQVNAVSISSQATALILAASNNKPSIIRALLKAGAAVNAANGYGNTALHEACHAGLFDIATILVGAHANVNIQNHKGSTPLHSLCYGESRTTHSLEFLKFLVQSGANVNVRDARGATPLLVCCASGRLDFIQFLIESGADPTVRDGSKQDAHDIAVFYQHKDVAAHFHHDSPFKRHGGYEHKHSDEQEAKSHK